MLNYIWMAKEQENLVEYFKFFQGCVQKCKFGMDSSTAVKELEWDSLARMVNYSAVLSLILIVNMAVDKWKTVVLSHMLSMLT